MAFNDEEQIQYHHFTAWISWSINIVQSLSVYLSCMDSFTFWSSTFQKHFFFLQGEQQNPFYGIEIDVIK